MPLTLVTGPANAGKARVVLDGYRAALARGEDPILVVPGRADVERYRAELAAGGAVFGTRVVRFGRLVDEIARRGGVPGAPLPALARERVAAAVVVATPLRALAASARTAGFARALLRLVDELEEARVTPQRLTQALRAWAALDPGRRAYGEEVAALYGAYRRRLERLGRRDAPLHALAALDAVAEHPAAWGATPVYLYGFDDLTPLQRVVVETLAATGADVMLSLAYEAGRMAFAGRATTYAELRPDAHRACKPRAEHYAPAARGALHHLERELFELPGEGRLFEPEPVDPGAALTLLQGGGERAELELVAAEIVRLVAEEGYGFEEVAVVLRDPAPVAALLDEVFDALGVPVAIERRIAFGHTALGRGLVALLRCALLDAGAADLLAWLRTPGLLRRPELADALEVKARRSGARTARAARELWEAEHWTLGALDRVRAAARRGPADLLDCAACELDALFAAPRRRGGEVLAGPAAQDADVLVAGRRALDELRELVAESPDLAPSPAELVALLDELDVHGGSAPGRGRVTVTGPLALRARRVRALFACRLQEGVFPALPSAEPFFGDVERARVAAASGLRLRVGGADLAAERYLFYATISRPEERLYLSWHEATDDGDPSVPSFFLSDVRDLFGPLLWERRRTRTLGEVGWPGDAPSERARARAATAAGCGRREAAIAALADPVVVGELRERATWSASAVESWASCPVRWFVERRLAPEGLIPDPELMLRGAVAHRVLEATLSGLRARTGSARLDASSLPLARALACETLERLLDGTDARTTMSPDPSRQRALARRLRADLERYLEHAASDGSELEPSSFEVVFGSRDGELPALELGGGVRIGGRIDRIDRGPGDAALVYDYKGRNAPDGASWRRERKYQVALYVLAARELLGLDVLGGLYQPLGARDQRARGLVLADADPGLPTVATDRREREDFEATIAGVVEDVQAAVCELRSGALEPRPQTCGWNGSGCVYPTICRCAAA